MGVDIVGVSPSQCFRSTSNFVKENIKFCPSWASLNPTRSSVWCKLYKFSVNYYLTVKRYRLFAFCSHKLMLYNYHHSTKLYHNFCCRLYCYECAAQAKSKESKLEVERKHWLGLTPTISTFIYHTSNSRGCMGVNGEALQLCAVCKKLHFYCKSHMNAYQYYKSRALHLNVQWNWKYVWLKNSFVAVGIVTRAAHS